MKVGKKKKAIAWKYGTQSEKDTETTKKGCMCNKCNFAQ